MAMLLLLLAGVNAVVAQTPEEDEKARQKAIKAAQKAYRKRLRRPINGVIFAADSLSDQPDSILFTKFVQGVHFVDSLKKGEKDSLLEEISRIHHGLQVTFNHKDPFDPYGNPTYYRRGQGKFWYFGLGMCLLLVFMYYRAAFSKQFELRVRGLFNAYYYNELMNDRTITQFSGGSGVVFVFSQAVFSAGVMLNLIFNGYLQLNNFFVVICLVAFKE